MDSKESGIKGCEAKMAQSLSQRTLRRVKFPTSSKQGGQLSNYSKQQRKKHGFD